MNIDPRTSVIKERLSGIKKIVAVTGWKGGIGKSVIASVCALILAARGKKTGLLDLDFTGASAHVILGAGGLFPEEEKGITPPRINGVKFMTISFFSKNRAVALRGKAVSNAIIELLAITKWGKLDYLIIDMPPGISDAALDAVKFIRKARVLAVTTPSKIAGDVLGRALPLYKRLGVKICAVVENMSRGEKRKKGISACLPYDEKLEKAVGHPEELLKTRFAEKLKKILKVI